MAKMSEPSMRKWIKIQLDGGVKSQAGISHFAIQTAIEVLITGYHNYRPKILHKMPGKETYPRVY